MTSEDECTPGESGRHEKLPSFEDLIEGLLDKYGSTSISDISAPARPKGTTDGSSDPGGDINALRRSDVKRDDPEYTQSLLRRVDRQELKRLEEDNKRRAKLFNVVLRLLIASVITSILVMIVILWQRIATETMVSVFLLLLRLKLLV